MRPHVRIRLPDGTRCELGHGDLIGRIQTAALCLDDARVSEAHAMLSLRGQEFHLLALRRRFAVDGVAHSEIHIQPGLEIELAQELALTVEAVELPDEVLAIEVGGLPPQILTRVCSILLQPEPHLVSRYVGEAAAHVWNIGTSWRLRAEDGPIIELQPGVEVELEGVRLRTVTLPLASAGAVATRVPGGIHAPLRIVTHYESVHLHREDELPLVLTGMSARLLSELAAYGAPTSWELVARELWPADDRVSLRRKWDINLVRLRRKLRDARIRADLVRADGNGNVELCLREVDSLEERT